MPRANRFTIYDALEKSGYFDKNPANTFARDATTGATLFKGAQKFPKMMYHPKGEERVTVAAEVIETPRGPKEVGEQRELIWQIVDDQEQLDGLLAAGWWDHPSKAIRARIEALIAAGQLTEAALKTIPVMSSDSRIADLEAEIKRLTEMRATEGQLRDQDQDRIEASRPKTGAEALGQKG